MKEENLTTHQKEVFDSIVEKMTNNLKSFLSYSDIEERLFSLTGAAGTGKSFLTVQIVSHIAKTISESNYPYDNIWVTAPTHKATGILRDALKLQLNNKKTQYGTLHSFLKMKLSRDLNTGAEKFIADKFDRKQNRASLLVIDESSMIDPDLYALVIEAVQMQRIHEVLFIGDPYQLLPINNGENKVYQLPLQYQLTEIVRQKKDSDIIALSQKIKSCIKEQNFIPLDEICRDSVDSKEIDFFSDNKAFLEDFYKEKQWYDEDQTFTSFTNETVDILNDAARNQYWLDKGIEDPDFLAVGDTVRFKSALNADGVRSNRHSGSFHTGEEVQIGTAELKFNPEIGIKYWTCTVTNKKKRVFHVVDPNSLITFNRVLQNLAIDAKNAVYPTARKYWRKYYDLKNSYADIQYSFASTIHKLQGSTFDTVYIDLNSLMYNNYMDQNLKYRLVYVAVTRARNKVKLFY